MPHYNDEDFDDVVDWNNPQDVEVEAIHAIMILVSIVGVKQTVERMKKIMSDVQRIHGMN